MRDNGLKWYFPESKNIAGRGENDPQKELFPGNIYQTLIRESIQNSIDHPDPQSGKPVRVEYKIRKFANSEFNCFEELKKHIQACYDISNADKFKHMLEVINASEFYILDVSDYHTIGMDYDYDLDEGRFKKFVRYTGDPNKVAGSGGSHGYGKITYFSVSEINTIIVSSMTPDGLYAFEGVSRLATHPAKEPRCSYLDTGFWDLGTGAPVQQIHDIPLDFQRGKPGTTVSIPFVDLSNKSDIFKTCCEAVLRNFFAAITDGKLEVLIDFGEDLVFECDQDKIEDAFSKKFFYNPPYDKAINTPIDKFNPHPYWLAYKNQEILITDELSREKATELCAGKKYITFKKDLPILGMVYLFINVDIQNGNDSVVFMRCPRMVVYVKHNNPSRGYSAVFLCDDNRKEKGNDLLKNMEDAAHRTWSKNQLKIDKRPKEKFEQAKQIENEMTKFIEWCLDVVFPTNEDDSDDVELEDFAVPLISENETTNPLIGSLINVKGNDDDVLGAPVDLHVDQPLAKNKLSFIGKAQIIEPKKVKETEEKTGWTDVLKKKKKKRKEKNHNNKYYEEDTEQEEKTIRIEFPVKYRIFSDKTTDNQTIYTLIIHSLQDVENAYLTLTPVGETDDKSSDVNIITSSIGQTQGNEISKVHLTEGKTVIKFTTDNSEEYAFSLITEQDVIIKD